MVNERLKNAVIEQLGGDDESIEYAKDTIESCGASGGVGGFIYYSETTKFARNNMDDIYALLKDQASEYGYDCAFKMVSEFNCLKDDKYSPHEIADVIYNKASEDDETQILNALAWYALEETIRTLEIA